MNLSEKNESSVLKMDRDALKGFATKTFPEFPFRILSVSVQETLVALDCRTEDLREGNTVLGPSQMGLADTCCYLAFLSLLGPEYAIVTSNFSINFLSRPQIQTLVCRAKVEKIGRRLCTASFHISDESQSKNFAHGICSYARAA